MGREGICRVEENEKGLQVAWIDSSPEAMRRQEALRKKERQDRGDEERERRVIREQIARAEMDLEGKVGEDGESGELKREEGETIKLTFGSKSGESKVAVPSAAAAASPKPPQDKTKDESGSVSPPTGVRTPPPEKVILKMGMNNKPKNVFAGLSKKNALGGKGPVKEAPKKPMSEAERIMKEELERKRRVEATGEGPNNKRPRFG